MSDARSCFKAYDIRGQVPDELSPSLAREIGLAYAQVISPPGPVVIGRDNRRSSPEIAAAVHEGLNRGGVPTLDVGLGGTELVYHAAARDGMGGGIMITASHNPADENGLKLVYKERPDGPVRPVTAEAGLRAMQQLLGHDAPRAAGAEHRAEDVWDGYVERVLRFVAGRELAPLKIVVDAGNGAAGPTVDRLAERLPFELIRLRWEPDGTFPQGVPNPLLPENRDTTAAAVIEHGADFGVAWDGDHDRCFLFDSSGGFIDGYYVVGLLAESLLAGEPGGLIVHDPRLFWNTREVVRRAGGATVLSRTGHARIKEVMVDWGCLYGGEMSAHHYFRDFAACDTGMVPWLLVAALVSDTGRSLGDLVAERIERYPISGEINRRVEQPAAVFRRLLNAYEQEGPAVDFFDGLSLTFDTWRANLRQSDTQPEYLRLNVESRGERRLCEAQTERMLGLIG